MHLIPVLLPLTLIVAAILTLIASEWSTRLPRLVAIAATVSITVMSGIGLASAIDGRPLTHRLGGWAAPIGVEYRIDLLSGYMALVIGVIGTAVAVYPFRAGFGRDPARRSPVLGLVLLVLAGLMGVVVSADLFHLFVALEIYAIATYALVALGGVRATFASFRYLIFGTIASGFYLLGVGFLYFMTGSLAMADVADRLAPLGTDVTVVAGLALIVLGLALKMALFPLHFWLPEAHSYAPTAVAALLAGIQVKVAAYALIRILYDVFGVDFVTSQVPVAELMAWAGAAGILFGSAMAILQTDIKRMLAYSTVAQLGYIGLGIGLAEPLALVAALLHVLAHALAKGCLFLVAGGVYDRTGIRDISGFAGLARRMPVSAAALTVAALSMVGVPPLIGFFSKWYLLLGALEQGQLVFVAVIAVSSLMTLAYFLRIIEAMYLRGDDARPSMNDATEQGAQALTPVIVLAGSLLVVGLLNSVIVAEVLEPIASSLIG